MKGNKKPPYALEPSKCYINRVFQGNVQHSIKIVYAFKYMLSTLESVKDSNSKLGIQSTV